jgi:UPF0755 protein
MMKRWLFIAGLIGLAVLIGLAYYGFHRLSGRAVHLSEGEMVIYVDSATTLQEVRHLMISEANLKDTFAFDLLAARAELTQGLIPGRYLIRDGMSIRQLVNMLRAGLQKPFDLVIRPVRSLDELCLFLGERLQASPSAFRDALVNDSLLEDLGLSEDQLMLMIIPNTYEVWWTTSARGFAERMASEYRRFWNEERREKAAEKGLSPAEVGILASIVQEETNRKDEMARIAGVYLNRLKRGMLLQADPTVKFAAGNPGLRRILFKHLAIDSPFNTYLYKGLPPGPLNMPETFVIEAVLNAENHTYLFFCASPDLDGTHLFARTNAEHSRNANAYRRALNERRIFE